MDKKIKAQIDEYHLMIEEVLGGVDLMLSRIDKRVFTLEAKVDRILDNNLVSSEVNSLRKDMAEMESDLLNGLELAFRKINEK